MWCPTQHFSKKPHFMLFYFLLGKSLLIAEYNATKLGETPRFLKMLNTNGDGELKSVGPFIERSVKSIKSIAVTWRILKMLPFYRY